MQLHCVWRFRAGSYPTISRWSYSFSWRCVTRSAATPRRRGYPILFLGLVVVGSAVLPLIHEAFWFICGPAFALSLFDYFARRGIGRFSDAALAYLLILSLVLFAAVMLNAGNKTTVGVIWDSIGEAARHAISPGDPSPSGGIAALGLAPVEALAMSLSIIRSGMIWYWLMPIVMSAALLAYGTALTMSTAPSDRRILFARGLVLYGTILVGCLPLFLAGWDWGRWIVGINLAFFFVFDGLSILPPPLERSTIWLANRLPRMERPIPDRWLLAGFIVFGATVRLPGCCITSSHFEPYDYMMINLWELLTTGELRWG